MSGWWRQLATINLMKWTDFSLYYQLIKDGAIIFYDSTRIEPLEDEESIWAENNLAQMC